MTLTIELTPELERRLREQAEREGLDAGRFLERLVESHLADQGSLRPPRKNQSPEEWDRSTQEWIHSLSHPGPVLADESISRESIYEERVNAILGRHEHHPAMGGTPPPDESSDQNRHTDSD